MKKIVLLLGGILCSTVINAQVGIGTMSPNKSAQLLTFKEDNEPLVSGTFQFFTDQFLSTYISFTTTIKTCVTVDFPTVKFMRYIHNFAIPYYA